MTFDDTVFDSCVYCGSNSCDGTCPSARACIRQATLRPIQAPVQFGSEQKPTNPKDMIGSDKLPMHLWPTTATALGCLGFLDGALKYGRANFRAVGVRSSIYYDALRRHLDAWWEGEDIDPDSGLDHFAHILACAAIIVEARAAGNLNDDRAFPTGYRAMVASLTPHVARLKQKHADKSPKHYTLREGGQ